MHIKNATIETGCTKGWGNLPEERFFARIIYPSSQYVHAEYYAFGATEELAWTNLLQRIQENRGE